MKRGTKPPPPDFIHLIPEANTLIQSLAPESELRKNFNGATDKLKENMFAGDQVEKRKFPKCYIQKYEIYNLYRMDLGVVKTKQIADPDRGTLLDGVHDGVNRILQEIFVQIQFLHAIQSHMILR